MSRTPKLERAELDASGRAAWDAIAAARGGVPTSYRHLFASPRAATAVADLGGYLRFGSTVDPRARELAVLVVNNETGCDFGWLQHAVVARGMGIPDAVIDELRASGTPTGLSAVESLGVRAAQEITRNGSASAGTVAELADTWGYGGATDFILAIGYYTMLAQYFLSMDLQIDEAELGHLTKGADITAAQTMSDHRP